MGDTQMAWLLLTSFLKNGDWAKNSLRLIKMPANANVANIQQGSNTGLAE
jgi:hypothetical protein